MMKHVFAGAGFDTLRVPVAWTNLMGDNYTISDQYLSAVREVVDWAMDCGLYVILNLHYDRSSCKMYDDTLMQQLLAIKGSEKPETLLGDCNQDGAVSAADAVVLAQYLLGAKALSEPAAKAADCTGDGVVNGMDLARLRQLLTV